MGLEMPSKLILVNDIFRLLEAMSRDLIALVCVVVS